jgi:hypothetical protein
VITIVMISITTWDAVMMEGTVVDVTLTRNIAQYADALTQLEQLAQQLLQLHQLLQPHQLLPLQAILQEQALLRIQLQQEDAAQETQDGLVITFVMMSITTWAAAMMEGTVVDVTLIRNTAQSADALTQMEVAMEQLVHKQQPALQIQQQALQIQQQVLQIRTALQQLEDATRDGLVIIFVMISTTTLAAAMMEGTVVDVTLTLNTAQSADALTQMEAGAEQLAQQLLPLIQVCQQLMTQVLMIQHCWCFDFVLGQISKSDKIENLKIVLFQKRL